MAFGPLVVSLVDQIKTSEEQDSSIIFNMYFSFHQAQESC